MFVGMCLVFVIDVGFELIYDIPDSGGGVVLVYVGCV